MDATKEFLNQLHNLTANPEKINFYEQDRDISSRTVLLTIAELKKRFVSPSRFIGLSMYSPSLLFSAILASWQNNLVPILLDPALKGELTHFYARVGQVPIFHDECFSRDTCRKYRELPNTTGHLLDISVPEEDEICLGFMTSGSEGDYKIIYKQGRQIFRELAMLQRTFSFSEKDRFLSFVPPYHIYGFLFGEMLPMFVGGDVAFSLDSLLVALFDDVITCQPTVVIASPLHYAALCSIQERDLPLPGVTCLSSGAPLPVDISRRFEALTGQAIHQIYGSTETGGIARRIHDEIWKPLPGVSLRIRPEDDIIEVQSAWASSDSPDSWESTTDAGRQEKDGFHLMGRAGTLLKFRGKRFSTCEVENVFRQYHGVEKAAVFSFTVDSREYLAAFVVCSEGINVSEGNLCRYVREHIAAFKVPRLVKVVPELPTKKLGKLDYVTLRTMATQFFLARMAVRAQSPECFSEQSEATLQTVTRTTQQPE